MKINVMKYTSLVSLMSHLTGYTFSDYECQDLLNRVHDLEEVNTYQPPKADVLLDLVDQLMMLMAESTLNPETNVTRKIEAIKVYRQLTGLGLKESKDAVEKYWKPATVFS